MAEKTMIRQLLSKWGMLSVDLVMAYDADLAVIREDGTKDYVDNGNDIIDAEVVHEEVVEPTVQPKEEQNVQAALFGN